MVKLSIKQQAKKNGDRTFFTGKTCKWGHLSPRLTINSVCLACAENNMRKKRTFKAFDEPIKQTGWTVTPKIDKDAEFNAMAKMIYKRNQKW